MSRQQKSELILARSAGAEYDGNQLYKALLKRNINSLKHARQSYHFGGARWRKRIGSQRNYIMRNANHPIALLRRENFATRRQKAKLAGELAIIIALLNISSQHSKAHQRNDAA